MRPQADGRFKSGSRTRNNSLLLSDLGRAAHFRSIATGRRTDCDNPAEPIDAARTSRPAASTVASALSLAAPAWRSLLVITCTTYYIGMSIKSRADALANLPSRARWIPKGDAAIRQRNGSRVCRPSSVK